jgi:hypothetical protein
MTAKVSRIAATNDVRNGTLTPGHFRMSMASIALAVAFPVSVGGVVRSGGGLRMTWLQAVGPVVTRRS